MKGLLHNLRGLSTILASLSTFFRPQVPYIEYVFIFMLHLLRWIADSPDEDISKGTERHFVYYKR